MRYIYQILQPGERLVHTATIHWIVYVPGAVLLVLALIVVLLLHPDPSAPPLARWSVNLLSWALALAGAAWVAQAWLRRFSTEIDVTDRRVVYKRGLFRRHTVEMNMDKVESVDVDQSILGRIFDYGDVTVRGTGVTMEKVSLVQAPVTFRNHVTAR